MAPTQPSLEEQDDQYDAASDEDFNPDAEEAAAAEVSSSSNDDDDIEDGQPRLKKGTKRPRDEQEDLDSGDEATIQERKKLKRRRKKQGKGKVSFEDVADADVLSDSGGEGGFVKTRSQRRTEKVERRALASTLGATVDVDSVWARLAALPIGRSQAEEEAKDGDEEEYITIKRTTRFAGQVTTEEKRVLKSSKEARIWLEEQEAASRRKTSKKADEEKENDAVPDVEPEETVTVDQPETHKPTLRRPLKRPLRWDPNPTGFVKTLPPNLQLRWPRDRQPVSLDSKDSSASTATSHRMLPPPAPGTKLNTVQKSKYDWASYVDKEKLAEELDEYGKSKQSYAGRSEFLGRLEQRKEEERLAARGKVLAGR